MRTVLVITGGGSVRRALPTIESDALVIAADGGVAEARRLGLRVAVLVGDLDSASDEDVAWVEAGGGIVEPHPPDKDATDLELAITRAVAEGADHVIVVGGDGGRLDHLLGNLLVLASPRWSGVAVGAILGDASITVIRDAAELRGEPGGLVSLFAVGGVARGVSTDGLRWTLRDADLAPTTSLGVSNEFLRTDAAVRVREGVVLAVQPG
jgi:thiamine pyrophosphokinase